MNLLPRDRSWLSQYNIGGPLPVDQRHGLLAITIMALGSTLATVGLLIFITYRLIFWRKSFSRYIGYNQYIVLIYNLILADLQQSLAFLICLKWLKDNEIEADTAACFLQGLWLQIGDPGSGLFVFAIAVHTFLLVIWGHKLRYRMFVASIVGIWVFILILLLIPLATHGRDVFVPSTTWCWINAKYEPMRLWTHYLWIFLAEFGTVCLYAIMFFQLRHRIAQSAILGSAHIESLKRLRRVVGYMVIYPIAYLILSLPLAAGRMALARGDSPSVLYFCVAGAMMTSSGMVDVTLYTLTRRSLIIDSEPSDDRSYPRAYGERKGAATALSVLSGGDPTSRRTEISAMRSHNMPEGDDDGDDNHSIRSTPPRHGSTDRIVATPAVVELAPMTKVYQHTTIEITTEPAYPSAQGDGGNPPFQTRGRSSPSRW
ncbi:hypothetical protein ASPZODRAFT_1235751 [Penicilliopsis zonata CBS 506.65]|uniref:G protein-coupled receptor GPR1/2/3 C-terminal domain-containing protein n=1 Tax=Penicilliopsis zonata CBS 506.65 TaxID=1073090 RepID=A0A1L9S6W6_9EURO|nr:hypothetical protein ASPZODRAFT_1235751 [Penicilliopsis zonata CBS 506.65]OJJ42901.1 hypothetical protein ASPZODRAFT_1235751 [Penicilliopsis zonata CBS 506.65]